MEFSGDESPTPRFGNEKDDKTVIKESLGNRIPKFNTDIIQYLKTKKKSKDKKKCSKEKSEKSKSKEKRKSKNKNTNKSKEKIKTKYKFSILKNENISGLPLPIEHKYENPLYVLLKKKLELRNDFDQNNSEIFLSEKELAFQQFQMNDNENIIDV